MRKWGIVVRKSRCIDGSQQTTKSTSTTTTCLPLNFANLYSFYLMFDIYFKIYQLCKVINFFNFSLRFEPILELTVFEFGPCRTLFKRKHSLSKIFSWDLWLREKQPTPSAPPYCLVFCLFVHYIFLYLDDLYLTKMFWWNYLCHLLFFNPYTESIVWSYCCTRTNSIHFWSSLKTMY